MRRCWIWRLPVPLSSTVVVTTVPFGRVDSRQWPIRIASNFKAIALAYYAGMGIIAASNAPRELEETQWKLQAMLSALVQP